MGIRRNGNPVMDQSTGEIRVLGIETSCDETAAAVVSLQNNGDRAKILSNIVFSQIDEHAAFGGVVPEIAARAHVEKLDGVVRAALADAKTELAATDAIAVTAGPGLIGGLIAGLMEAKAIAAALDKPLYTINHLEGHALTARLTDRIAFPYLLLLVSGGHTQIIAVEGVGRYRRYASTIDDALGEAFDKTAKLLGLPHPGGPSVEKWAESGDSSRFSLPRPLKGAERPDFSFSGLKTAVRQLSNEISPLSDKDVADICASFQAAVTDTISDRISKSLVRFREEFPDAAERVLVAAGGVAANETLRSGLRTLCAEHDFRFIAPPLALCSDNAAMIAFAAIERMRADLTPDDTLRATPRPRWPLDELADPLLGHGKRGAKA